MFGAPAVAVAVMMVAGCAPIFPQLEQDPDFGHYFSMRKRGDAEQARLDGPRLHGPDVEVTLSDSGFRGRTHVGIIDLRVDGDHLTGNAGSGRTDLVIAQQGDTVTIHGSYAGKLGELHVQPNRITGQVGSCQYDVSRRESGATWLEGRRTCGGPLQSIRLALPKDLDARPLMDRVALLVLFLGL